jgi:tetratricopeptide (TPR) repeat protein
MKPSPLVSRSTPLDTHLDLLASGHVRLGVALEHADRLNEARNSYLQALALQPWNSHARFGLGRVLLRLGVFPEAWHCYEARYDPARGEDGPRWNTPTLDCPQWRGEPLQGKSLVVWFEQGYGDMIQFGRFLGELKARGAARITLVCYPALKRLFERAEAVDTLIGSGKFSTLEDVRAMLDHDYWTLPFSIPRWLETTPSTLPRAVYLTPDPALAQAWAARLSGLPGLKVGLVWRGNPAHDNDHNRSLPGLRVLAPLWRLPGVSFVSLQTRVRTGPNADPRAPLPPERTLDPDLPLLDLGSELQDFADTAALISRLDLVISVDTATAHVAGALGAPCWVLLPAERTDWRWTRAGDRTPWYPDTLRLFRQAQPGDWFPVIQRIGRVLRQAAAGAATTSAVSTVKLPSASSSK